jgi:hypothetical protein
MHLGNRKMFPVCVHSFDSSEGIQCKLLDFVQEPDDNAGAIHRCFERQYSAFCPGNFGNLGLFSADNASVNFWEEEINVPHLLDDSGIVKADCVARNIRNSKHG